MKRFLISKNGEMTEMLAKTYKKRIIKNMRAVGTYRPEFAGTIEELAQMLEDLDKAREEFDASGGKVVIEHTNKNGSTNLAKNPLYLALEGMQTRILAYYKELGLTPMGLKKIKGDEAGATGQTELLEALKDLGG